MHVESIAVALSSQVQPPVVKAHVQKGWVEIGEKNQFFEQLIKIKKGSTTQTRCINTRTKFVAGEGFVIDEKDTALKEFFDNISGEDKSANDLLKKIAKDFALFRGFALQVIWDKGGKSIAELHYQRFKSVRSGLMNDDEEVEEYYISRDWSKTLQGKFKPQPIPAFNPNGDKTKPQLFYYFEESEDVEYYPLPDYWPATDYMELEYDLAQFHRSNVANNFALGNILTVPEDPQGDSFEGGLTADEKRKKFKKQIEETFTGPRAKKLMVLFGITGENGNAADVKSFKAENNDTLYDTYKEMCRQEILTSNGVTSPVIVGLPGEGSLGGNGNELRNAFELYYNTEIRPDQKTIIEQFLKLLKYRKGVQLVRDDKKPVLEIVTTLPVKFTFSENLLSEILPPSRLRGMIDEPELTPDEEAEMGYASADPNGEGAEGLDKVVLKALKDG